MKKYLFWLAGAGALYLLLNKKKSTGNNINIDKAVEFIKDLEGFNPNAFNDYKQISIGYGTVAKNRNEIITKQEGENRLRGEIKPLVTFLINKGYKINNNQFNALLSFIYNVGKGGLVNTGLDAQIKLNSNDKSAITMQFNKWVRAGGQINKGLQNRRQKEINLYFS